MSKPEALRLADRLEGRWALHCEMQEAAAELRRLHQFEPEALRLADRLEGRWALHPEMQEAAAELRRLHALLEAEQELHQRVTYPELRRLRAQRAALLEALKGLMSEEPNIYEGRLEASLYVTVDALEAACAAIAKVEGEKT